MMDKRRIIEMRAAAQALDATVHVGKEGVNEALCEEISRQLKKKKLVKVRLLRAFSGEPRECGEQLALETESAMVEVRGRTVVLAKE